MLNFAITLSLYRAEAPEEGSEVTGEGSFKVTFNGLFEGI